MKFDCVVLSGGGAKGAYSAGVCKALFEYRRLKNIESQLCFIGTSSGALNACIIAALGEDELLKFWRGKVNNQTILGTSITNATFQFALNTMARPLSKLIGKPFSIYPSTTSCLRKLINQAVPKTPDTKQDADQESLFTKLRDKHVIFTATNYTKGRLRSFYISSLFDKFVQEDTNLPPDKKRLSHCKRIEDQQQLTDCLLASSAVPVFFPPVPMDGDLYIDGGVGNNTPTREAAYFMRFLEQYHLGTANQVYCIKQDTPQIILREKAKLGLTDILKRTLDIEQYVHMEPIISNWENINNELDGMDRRAGEFQSWLNNSGIPSELASQISKKVHDDVCRLGGSTKRLNLPIMIIQPTKSLGDTLDFESSRIEENILLGYQDMLLTLRNQGCLTVAEYSDPDVGLLHKTI